MHITCIMVSSVDGKTTQPSTNLHSWTSPEDQEYFAKQIEKAECILMGRKTYSAAKTFMKHASGRLRIVFTNNPQDFSGEVIPNQLEFTSDSPAQVMKQLEKRGFITALLVGGAQVNKAFLKANLIDELWLTIEPVILGKGNPLFAENDMQKKLQLISLEKLNNNGTILLKYYLQSIA